MKSQNQETIDRANEIIRRNRQARKLISGQTKHENRSKASQTLNCANAFARNGKNLEHLWDKIF